jgi:GntP family gluconate:H+ symporter
VTALAWGAVGALAAAAAPAAGPGQLLTAVIVAIAVIVVLISWLELHPFLALTIGSAVLAAVAGVGLDKALASFGKGFGGTTADVGILIALGAMLGKLLADSGGADQVVDTILAGAGPRRLPWAMALIAFVIGIPMFFEVGLVLLVPVVILVARRGHHNLIRIGIPALAGLSVLHGLVPPHPGPLIAISALHANLGITLATGVAIAVPTVVLAGPVLGNLLSRWVEAHPPPALVAQFEAAARRPVRPGFGATLATILLPVALMLARTIAEAALSPGPLRSGLEILGTPLVALLLAVLLGMFTLGRGAGLDRHEISASVAGSLPAIAGIILIVGAGGGFKQTIIDTGVAAEISRLATHLPISPLLVGWTLAVLIRLATGSATVATTTAAGIVSPLATTLDPFHVSLLVLAVGSGSLFLSHVNDAGFWLVKEYFGMTVGQTLRTWSVMETAISVIGIVLVLIVGTF